MCLCVSQNNGSCSDAMTLPINDWLFHLEGVTYSAILHIALSPIHKNMSALYLYIKSLWFDSVNWLDRS